MEFIFGVFGDAYWVLHKFEELGSEKGYVNWSDILELCRKTNTFVDKYSIESHQDEGWTYSSGAYIDPVNDYNWNDKWKLVLPPIKKLKFKGGKIIHETRNNG